MMHEVKCLSAGQSLAEVFLIGWAFAFMISGGCAVSLLQCDIDLVAALGSLVEAFETH
jgi:hypothetical protein